MIYTPYKAAKITNTQLKDLGIEKVLPPQMFYTYTKKNYIKSTIINDKIMITDKDLAEWFVTYLTNNFPHKINNTDNNIDKDQLNLF